MTLRTTHLAIPLLGFIGLTSPSLEAQDFPESDASARMSVDALRAAVRRDMPAPRYGARLEKSVWVPMRDGVRLSTDIYLPETGAARLPVILMRTPYGKKDFGLDPTGPYGSEVAMFVGQGFAVAVQDTRGRYESEGVHRTSANARRDGYDALTWIASRPWSNGRIGTYGCSYMGEVQYMLAATNHPNHSAMIAQSGGGALGLRGEYFNFGINHGGARELSTVSWFLSGYGTRHKPVLPPRLSRRDRIELARFFSLTPTMPDLDLLEVLTTLPLIDAGVRAGIPNSDLTDFIRHGPADDYWVGRGFLQADDQIHVPALHVDSWYDKMIGATLAMYERARSHPDARVADHQYLVVSPSTHCRSEELTEATVVGQREMGDARFGYWDLYVRWFDHWLTGTDNGVLDTPAFQGFVMGRNQWRRDEAWPIPGTVRTRFYLTGQGPANSRFGSGVLQTEPSTSEGSDELVYDPMSPVPSLGGSFCCISAETLPAGSYDHSAIEERPDVLVYTTEPLDSGVEVTGEMEAVLYASSSAPDTDFVVKLLDVDTEGRAFNLKEAVLRARYREGFDREVFMEPGEIYEFRIKLHATSNYFAPGHRIRIEVSSSSFPRIERNLNTGGRNYDEVVGIVARNRVHHGGRFPSHVVLPVVVEGGTRR